MVASSIGYYDGADVFGVYSNGIVCRIRWILFHEGGERGEECWMVWGWGGAVDL